MIRMLKVIRVLRGCGRSWKDSIVIAWKGRRLEY